MSLTDEYREAFSKTDDTMDNLAGLIIALHDRLLEASSNTEKSRADMGLVNAALELAERALERHGEEWEVVKNVPTPKSEVTA